VNVFSIGVEGKILMLLEWIKLPGQTMICLQQQPLNARNELEIVILTGLKQRLPVTTLEERLLLNTDAMSAHICWGLRNGVFC
jgi:hypothetical protein